MESETIVAVTGANSAVGCAILRASGNASLRSLRIVAAVRSERAARELPPLPDGRGRIARIDYGSEETLRNAFAQASAVIHLPGILVERRDASYEDANLRTTAVALEAAKACGVQKFVLISAVGARADSPNRYLATKGAAERLVAASGISYTILRPPLVLGPGTEGSAALARSGRAALAPLLRGGRVLHQPIDVEDLAVGALRAARTEVAQNRSFDLAGPERLSYRTLLERAAGRSLRVLPIPVAPLRILLGLRQRLFGPGFSPDALDTLVADTEVDSAPGAALLGIELTPLETTLARSAERSK